MAKSIPSRGDGKEVNGYVDGEGMNDEWALKRCPNPSHRDRVVRAREGDAATSGETIEGEERSKEEEEWSWVSEGPPFLHPAEEEALLRSLSAERILCVSGVERHYQLVVDIVNLCGVRQTTEPMSSCFSKHVWLPGRGNVFKDRERWPKREV